MSAKKTPMCILCTIVERGAGQRIARFYEKHGVDFHYRVSGSGTASSDLLDILGIGTPPAARKRKTWWKSSTATAWENAPTESCSCCR